MSEHIKEVTDSNFEAEVLNSSRPVLLDFWAPWCGPCRALTPIFEDVSTNYVGKVTFAKINIDDNSDTPSKYGVMSIPTLILFKDGQVQATKLGSLQKSELIAFIDSNT